MNPVQYIDKLLDFAYVPRYLKNPFSPWPVDDIQPWMIWGYYISPMMYGQNAIAINEFLDDRWSAVSSVKG